MTNNNKYVWTNLTRRNSNLQLKNKWEIIDLLLYIVTITITIDSQFVTFTTKSSSKHSTTQTKWKSVH